VVLSVVLFLLIGLALLWCVIVAHTAWMLTHPPRRTYATAVARGRAGDPGELPVPRRFEEWTLSSGGLEFPVWDIPGDTPEGPVVVLTHGWGDSRLGALQRLEGVCPAASRVIAWDLPGHGVSRGICRLGTSEVGHLIQLVDSLGPPVPTVLMGWSLGAGASIGAAPRRAHIVGVIAETPYRLAPTPARKVLRARRLPWRATLAPAFALLRVLLGARISDSAFDRKGLARSVEVPLLVLHGNLDEICPVEDGKDIAGAAPRGSIAVIDGGSHNRLWSDPPQRAACERAVQGFLREIAAVRVRMP
jgi:pimeloyl-ACP methyl ester carboxylesterase